MTDPTSTIIDSSNLLGRTVSDRYAVESVLGDGSMGIVFLAEHTHMKKKVALKVMKAEYLDNPEAVERFQREAQATGHIEHPHVCSATDFGRLEDDRFFLVMEYLDGQTLGELLDNERRLEPERTVKIVRQIAQGLQRAHELEVVHRDLKPDNVILVEREGDTEFVKITDFGVARVEVVDAQNLTQAGTTMGTPVYMSPEQAVARRADARSDLYTLGVMMFEMLAGEVPFYSDSLAVILSMHANEPPPLMHDVAPDALVPEDLCVIVERLLHKQPEERFQSAVDLIEALDAADLSPYVLGLAAPSSKSINDLSTPSRPPVPAAKADLSGSDMFDSGVSASDTVSDASSILPPPRKPGMAEQWAAAPAGIRYGIVFVVLSALAIPVMAIAIMFVSSSGGDEGGGSDDGMAFSEDEIKPADLAAEQVEFLEDVDLEEKFATLAPGDAATTLAALVPEHGSNAHLRYLIGKAKTDAGAPEEAMEHYLAAIESDPRYSADTRLISDVRRVFGDKSEDVAGSAKPVLLALLGADKAGDIEASVFEVGLEGSWNARKRARDLLKEAGKWDAMPQWQQDSIALGLIGKKSCTTGLKYVRSLAKSGEPGALPALEKASRRSKEGCGFLNKGDCYKCMRSDLASAIKDLKSQAAEPDAPSEPDPESDPEP